MASVQCAGNGMACMDSNSPQSVGPKHHLPMTSCSDGYTRSRWSAMLSVSAVFSKSSLASLVPVSSLARAKNSTVTRIAGPGWRLQLGAAHRRTRSRWERRVLDVIGRPQRAGLSQRPRYSDDRDSTERGGLMHGPRYSSSLSCRRPTSA